MAASIFLSLSDLTTKILSCIPHYFSSSSSKSSLASKLTKEIAKLDRTLRGIQAVLADAEEREIRDESVKFWLSELKQVAYSAEEVLEDFNYELQKRRSETNLSVNASVSRQDCENSRKKQKLVSFSRLDESSFIEDLLDRIVKVKEELDDISRDRDRLSLREEDGLRRPVESHSLRGSSSLVDSFGIFGRENEKNRVLNVLLESGRTSDTHDNSRSVETISIIGMGGMGKTTLARLVYNDERVKKHFKLRAWIWVSEIYDEVRLTKTIIESLTSEPCYLSELDSLQNKLKEIVKNSREDNGIVKNLREENEIVKNLREENGIVKNLREENGIAKNSREENGTVENKMFLLVLDDIWNEDPIRWDTLKKPLLAGVYGSRLIITTRNKNVASVMDSKLALHLDGLERNDSWKLFSCFAFKGKSTHEAPSSLVSIGRKIVEKSKGVPLVVRILGSLLSPETSEESWADVLESDLWELDGGKKFIFPVLKISYQRLPSPIKPCFAYCASFPKGYEFNRDDLVRIWDALGFIPSNRKNDSVAIGISFVDDLVSRSFFQIKSSMGSNKILMMHDLIHDLASLIAGNECLTLESVDSNNVNFSGHLRHLYGCPSLIPNNGHFALRSFYPVRNLKFEELTDLTKPKENINIPCLIEPTECTNLTGSKPTEYGNLTTLIRLIKCRNLTRLIKPAESKKLTGLIKPAESRNLMGLIELEPLQYLKVLDVSSYCPPCLYESIGYFKHLRYLSFSKTEIPESVGLLYNLQTLKIIGGFSELRLPMYLYRLINLKHLIIPKHSVKSMSVRISELRNLQTLSVFAVCRDVHGASLAELKELNNLKGELYITQLYHITCDRTTEAEEACLSKKEHLTSLTLKWVFVPVPIPHDEQVLSYLRPHMGIQKIKIVGYRGRKFSGWLGDRKFSRVSEVILDSCGGCEKLPALGELPCLKHLEIKNMFNIKHIGCEFYGSSSVSFPLLETLCFRDMPNWEEWWTGEGDANLFPCLVKLELTESLVLASFSVANMPSLETLLVSSCGKLTIKGRENHPRQVKISGCF